MNIQIVLNPDIPQYQEIKEALEEELNALKGLTFERVTEPAPPKTLAVDHNVLQYLFSLKDSVSTSQLVSFVTVLLQIVNTVLKRVESKSKKENPPAVIVVRERALRLPGSPSSQKRYISELSKGKKSESATPRKKASPKKKKITR